jgi:hypothetical protein
MGVIVQSFHLTLRSVAKRSVSKGGKRHGAGRHPSRHSLRSFLRVR